MNRREILKFSIGTVVTALMSPFAMGQASDRVAPGNYQLPANKLNDTVTYNAGWIVPLEDKAQLLELEAKKSSEQKAAKPADAAAPAKDKSKTIADRYQEFIGKVKSFF